MGFIPKPSQNEANNLTAYLTQRGRELLLNGSESDISAKYFVLGDSDTNYNTPFWLTEGNVPDLSGDKSDCVFSLAQNIGIKHAISRTSEIVINKEVRFLRPDNGKYYATLDCLIHLDRIARYQLFHAYKNAPNSNRLKVQNDLKSPMADLYSKIKILTRSTEEPVQADFFADDEMVFEMLFDANVFKGLNNTYIETTSTNTYNNVSNGIKSPLIMTFSSTDTGLKGSGRASVGILSREMGYLYKAEGSNLYDFFNSSQVENIKDYVFYTDENNTILNKFTDFTLAARIKAKDKVTGAFKDYIYRGDKNLLNINDNTLQSISDEKKFANQYAKLFADNTPVVDGTVSSDGTGIMSREIANLKDFVETSNIFSKVDGTNEFRTNKLTFNVYPKSTSGATPATLNLIFKFDEDEVLEGDLGYESISNEGNTQFIQYEFVATNGIFYNQAKSATARRNNCGANKIGTEYTYVVPSGTFSAMTQAGANLLAQDYANTNVQTEANKDGNGVCNWEVEYQSDPIYGYYSKSGCDYKSTPVLINYPQGKYTSFESKNVANNLAQIAAQTEANETGSCIPRPMLTINFQHAQGHVPYIDSNLIMKANGEEKAVSWVDETGSFTAYVGDIITVQQFSYDTWETTGYSSITVTNNGVTVYSNSHTSQQIDLGTTSFRLEENDNYFINAYAQATYNDTTEPIGVPEGGGGIPQDEFNGDNAGGGANGGFQEEVVY